MTATQVELSWENLTILANLKKEKKIIINNIKGILRPE